jgi:hypothetical protein
MLNLDKGYHYENLDWCFGGVASHANLTIGSGTAVGWFELPGAWGAGYGIGLYDNQTVTFNGTATASCVFARYSNVQEGGNGNWRDKGWLAGIASFNSGSGQPSHITASFTHCALKAGDPNNFRDYANSLIVRANNCEIWSGGDGGYGAQYYWTNCLFDRSYVGLTCNCSPVLSMRNCTMHGGSLLIQHWSGATWPVWIENCAFDGTAITMDAPSTGTYCDYNAFLTNGNRLAIAGLHDITNLTSFDWETGPLGNFYLPTNSPLINTGSVTADVVGLFHFTVMTNFVNGLQIKETNSVVDLGFHTVAVDTNGLPISTSGDGIGDYLKDSNGDGIYESSDLADWRAYTSLNGLSTNSGLQVFTPLK